MYRLELLVPTDLLSLYQPIATETRSNDNAGVDLFLAANVNLTGMMLIQLLDMGVKARMVRLSDGEDVHYQLFPRSSIFKNNLYLANSVGVIDRTYRGNIMAAAGLINPIMPTEIMAGTRIVQIVAPDMGHISQVRFVDSLPDTPRGSGGFGSTGS
jgi:dUTP pyrophosphatase